MSRVERRRFEKEFAKLMKSAPDACDICEKPLPHNSKTFGGFARGGRTVLAGECCQHKMQQIYASGVYLSKNFDHLVPMMKDQSATRPVAEADATSAVNAIQSHFESIDAQAEEIALKAGLKTPAPPVFLGDSVWKTDDAAWFRSHPERSHRSRAMFAGELDVTHPAILKMQALENHQIEVLVRQVEVGKRVRTAFARDLSIAIPDVEEIVHALFDLVAQSGGERVLGFAEVAALAEMYGASFAGKPS